MFMVESDPITWQCDLKSLGLGQLHRSYYVFDLYLRHGYVSARYNAFGF
jgi:hypothetical protein